MTTDPQATFTAELAERTIVVTWPDNERGGATPPPDGWAERALDQEATLHEVDEGSPSGCSVLRWRDDPRQDAELIAASLELVTGQPAAGLGVSATPSRTDQAFVLWLDASDGSVPTHDGIVWPDGTATIHHRHFGHTTTHADAEAARQAAHGKQGRIVWPKPADRAAVVVDGALHGARLIEAALRRLADAAPQQEPPVHGESVAHLAGLHDDKPTIEVQAAVDGWRGATELVPDHEVRRLAATGIVGYQQDQGRLLHCLHHRPVPASRWADFHEVTSDDLPDGGICVHPRCGADLLAVQPAVDARQDGGQQ